MSVFSKQIVNLRKKNKLSQNDLSRIIGVNSSNISKWENDKKMPTLEIIDKLSKLYNLKLNDLLIDNKNKKIIKIVITGGPCAGKTTALNLLQEIFTNKGYTVLFIKESAAELITSGINRNTCKTEIDFQVSLFNMQKKKEQIYYDMAQKSKNKVLIICDRGQLDSKAFLSEKNFKLLLKEVSSNEIELRDNYDAIFHLVSAAKGAEKYYTLENNAARTETIEEAAELDDKLICAWTGHPYLRIIDNSTNFENKIKRLVDEISLFLGEKTYINEEKRYLIEYPNIDFLQNLKSCKKVDVIQTYLKSNNKEEVSIEQRGVDGNYIYSKIQNNKFENVKEEKRITKEEYLKLLMDADINFRQIRKTRYCLMNDKCYCNIDIYPFWKEKAIMEFQMKKDKEILIPSYVNVLKEVSDDERYDSYSIAKSIF